MFLLDMNPVARPATSNLNFADKQQPRPSNALNLTNYAGSSPGSIVAVYTPGSKIQVERSIQLVHDSDPGVRIAIGKPGEPETVVASGLDVNEIYQTLQLPGNLTCMDCILYWSWDLASDDGYYLDVQM